MAGRMYLDSSPRQQSQNMGETERAARTEGPRGPRQDGEGERRPVDETPKASWLLPDTMQKAQCSVTYVLARAVANFEEKQIGTQSQAGMPKKAVVRVAAALGYGFTAVVGVIEFVVRALLASLLYTFVLTESKCCKPCPKLSNGATLTARTVKLVVLASLYNLKPWGEAPNYAAIRNCVGTNLPADLDFSTARSDASEE